MYSIFILCKIHMHIYVPNFDVLNIYIYIEYRYKPIIKKYPTIEINDNNEMLNDNWMWEYIHKNACLVLSVDTKRKYLFQLPWYCVTKQIIIFL